MLPPLLANPLHPLYLPTCALLGVLLDLCLGEPRRWHPLVGFGRLVQGVEQRLNHRTILSGVIAWLIVVTPWLMLAWFSWQAMPWLVDSLLLYFALGAKSLGEHAEAVATPLAKGDLPTARTKVGWMVSRDTQALDESGIAKAGMESVLENGNDAIFGTLFWFLLFGGVGALMFRLANTLDAMWGYRTERFNLFGRFAARFDDVINYIPARLTALTYAILGNTQQALSCWRAQAKTWESPNAGPVMSAGAGSLHVLLGGTAIYHGKEEQRPPLGAGQPPVAADLARAIQLIRRSLWLWLAVVWLIGSSLWVLLRI